MLQHDLFLATRKVWLLDCLYLAGALAKRVTQRRASCADPPVRFPTLLVMRQWCFFAFSFWLSAKRHLLKYRWYLRVALWALPLPWISCELGWIVAEYGRQPWTIDGVLPTYLSVSSISPGDVWFSLGGFALFYTMLAIVELFLMVKYIRLGPERALGHPLATAAVRA